MYFYLSKYLWLILAPANLITLMIVAGLLLGRRRPGRALLVCGVLALVVAGLSPASMLAFRPLEDRFPAFVDDGRKVDGVIVLGGALSPTVTQVRGQLALNEAGERIFALIDLARRYPQARVVFTGGSGDFTGITPSEADMVEQSVGPLLPPGRVEYERASRNTVENAELSFRQVKPQPGERWLLVTSAWHMPRSVGIFRKAGWTVTPYPVDYLSAGSNDDLRLSQSISGGLYRSDLVAKEWVGLLFAWLTGRSTALFPAPEKERAP